jgi:RimJ/RimL family protein N-acetyltransferase
MQEKVVIRTHKTLKTRRFDLVPMTIEDASLLADLGADPEVVKPLICDWSQAETRSEIARYWIERNQDFGIWGVYDRDGSFGTKGRFLGFCAADEPLPEGGLGPEIYYAFHRETWGRGLASEVVETVLAHLFRDQGVAAVEALVLPGLNPASNRMLERLGFRLIGRYSFADYCGEECAPTMGYEIWRVAGSPPELAQRNLEEAAFKIGQFLGDGIGSREEMARALEKAAGECGLAAQMEADDLRGLIAARLDSGAAETGWLHYRVMAAEFRRLPTG